MYTNNKNIAILLAAYNADKYIVEQIDSLLAQTNQDWTLYIRNDGSTDNTGVIISDYCKKHSNILEIDKGGKNLGCRNNFFRLLEVVDSDYYMFCDADDFWLSDKIEISVKQIVKEEQKHFKKPILMHVDAMICDSNLEVIQDSFWKANNINPFDFTSYNFMCVSCTVGGAKSIFNKYVKELIFPLKNNDFIFDYWIALNAAKCGLVIPIDIPLIKYRQHDSNVSGVTIGGENTLPSKLKNSFNILRKYKQESNKLKTIGFGGFTKYLYYKMIFIYKTRLS